MNPPAVKPPLVSVCVPTYNGAEFLRECLVSLQAQTLRDFEVIIVDDESADGTVAVAESFAATDARFRIHRNPRRLGLVGNWNQCLGLARGEWIKFLFQDDLLESRCLERLVTACESHGARLGFCQRHVLFDGAVAADLKDYFGRHQQLLAEIYGAQDSFLDARAFARAAAANLDWNLLGEPTVVLFHRSVVGEFGLPQPQMIQRCDSEYWLRIGTNTGVAHVAEKLATFRVHGQSTTSKNISKRDYRARFVDPLLQHWLILHEENYARLRGELCRNEGSLLNWWRLVWAANHAREMAFTPSAEPALRAEWLAVAAAFPNLETLARIGKCFTTLRALVPVKGKNGAA